MELYCTLLGYLNNHDPLKTGDFNYALDWIKKSEITNDFDELTSAMYCFLVSKILHCKRIGVKLNRVNAVLHVKNACNNQNFISMVDEAMNNKSVTKESPIAVLIMYYFLHIEERVESQFKIIDVLFDAYHEKLN
jgi:hypothetical protein